MTWERLVAQGRAKITDDDKYDINKQTTDNQNLKAGEQWYTLKVLCVCVHDMDGACESLMGGGGRCGFLDNVLKFWC